MPEHHILQCVSCKMFQILQVTKSPQWKCKVCAQKQSVVKRFATSDKASDLTKIVQQMNMARGTGMAEDLVAREEEQEAQEAHVSGGSKGKSVPRSCWEGFADEEEEKRVADDEEEDEPEDSRFMTSLPDRQRILAPKQKKAPSKEPQKKPGRGKQKEEDHEDDGVTESRMPVPVKRVVQRQQRYSEDADEDYDNHGTPAYPEPQSQRFNPYARSAQPAKPSSSSYPSKPMAPAVASSAARKPANKPAAAPTGGGGGKWSKFGADSSEGED